MIYKNIYHSGNIANALKGVVQAPISHVHQHLLDGLVKGFRVHALCCSKLLCCHGTKITALSNRTQYMFAL